MIVSFLHIGLTDTSIPGGASIRDGDVEQSPSRVFCQHVVRHFLLKAGTVGTPQTRCGGSERVQHNSPLSCTKTHKMNRKSGAYASDIHRQ